MEPQMTAHPQWQVDVSEVTPSHSPSLVFLQRGTRAVCAHSCQMKSQ